MSQNEGKGVGRRELFSLGAGAAALAASMASPAAATPPADFVERGPGVPVITGVVSTTNGKVRGLVSGGIQTFKGVRYGAPPIGDRRWMPPSKPDPWVGVEDCADFGAPAMQNGTITPELDYVMQINQVFTSASDVKVMNEDCLYLNVWTPALDGKKRPVMFWMHGGGFASGSGAQPIYDGEALSRFGDVVVVTVNHRLNIFGYLYLGAAMGDAYASSGTVGMQDLVLALEWVRDNIAGFGGDPGNVMIMGQSGGGVKVSALMAMPSAKGLFHKASIQSGPGLALGRKEQATATAAKFLAALNVAPGDIKALQALPAQTLLAAAAKSGANANPIVDGLAIPHDPFTPNAPEESADVPLLIGWCKDEPTLFTVFEPWFGTMTEADLQARIKPMGQTGQDLLAAFRKAFPDYSPTYLFSQFGVARILQATETLAERKAAQGRAPVYVWRMTWETPVLDGAYRTPHTMEIPFMMYSFDKVRAFVGPGPAPRHMADQLAGAWVAFARTGNPDNAAIPHWPAFNAQSRPVMQFNLASQVVNDPLSEVRQIVAKSPQGPGLGA